MDKHARLGVIILTLFLALLLVSQPGQAADRATVDPQTADAAWRAWDALPYDVKTKVDPRILAELRGSETPAHLAAGTVSAALAGQPLDKNRFLVYLRHQPDLAAFEATVFASQVERRAALLDLLIDDATAAQSGVKAALSTRLADQTVTGYQPFFVVNALAVEGDLATVVELAQRGDVARLVANYPLMAGPGPLAGAEQLQAAQLFTNWNIKHVGADRVWRELGVRGEGAVVAGFDTGVDWQHPALGPRYRGLLRGGGVNHNYNWFEPDSSLYPDGNLGPSRSLQPYDCSGHGSHTMGTMIGAGASPDEEVGMAPSARWIALPGICAGTMPGGLRDDIGALKAFQWLLCPTDLTGDLATADCSKAPDVVNNSWGSANPTNELLRPAIQRLRAAGISPVFSSGNPNAGAGSIGSPGNAPEAITVGAVDSEDQVAYFSGRGPSFYAGEQKPELSAPGVEVYSTVPGSGYLLASGTSMAAPHVAGLVALLVSADLKDGVRDLTVDEIERLMVYSAQDLGPRGPDDDYGYGRIRAYDAVRWALSAGDLRGVVRTTGGQPLPAATVTLADDAGNRFSGVSDAQGIYSTTAPAGVYGVTVTAWGYASRTLAGQQIFARSDSLADFTLSPLAQANVSGVVRSGGQPVVDALVSVVDQPARQVRTDAAGAYTLALPVGDHQLTIQATGQRITQRTLTVSAGGAQLDFALEPAPKLLLVEADASGGWFFGWPLRKVYATALTEQGYLFDYWPIQYSDLIDTQTLADGSLGYGVPSLATLAAYDVVIWAHGGCSPFWGCPYATVDRNLAEYLAGGGRLFFSGQDLGQLDGQELYDQGLHADLVDLNAAGEGDTVQGLDFLQGLHLTVTNASLYGYANGAIPFSPDAVSPQPGDGAAFPILRYDNLAGAAALAVNPCDQTGRAVYLALGYENLAARAASRTPRFAELLDRSLTWLQGERPARSFSLAATQTNLAVPPADRARFEVLVTNTGVEPLTLTLAVAGQQWPVRILHNGVELAGALQLAPCTAANLTVLVAPPPTTPLAAQDLAQLTVALDGDAASAQQVALTTVTTGRWQQSDQPALPRYYHGLAPLGELQLYAVGGWHALEELFFPVATSSVERYNVCTQSWELAPSLPAARANLGLAALGGQLYAVGGQDFSYDVYTTITHDKVYRLDPGANEWATVAALPEPYAGMAVVAAGGKLYAFGGTDNDALESNRTWIYDPATDRWQAGAAMPGGARTNAAAALLAGKIYVVGGWPELRRVEIYDPATNRWSNGPALNQGRAGAGLVAGPDGALYLIGGRTKRSSLGSTERYHPQTGRWVSDAPLVDPNRNGAAVAYAGGRIHTVGGLQATQTEALTVGPSFCHSQKRAVNAAIAPGTPVTYVVELTPGPTNLPAVGVVDSLPPELSFGAFVQEPGGASYNPELHQVEWSGPLPAGQPRQVVYTAGLAVDEWESGQPVTSIVRFSAGAGLVFTRTLTSLLLAPDFVTSRVVADRPRVKSGDPLTYTIRLQGETLAGGALALFNPLPTGVEYVANSLRYGFGTGQYDPATRSIRWAGVLPTGLLRNGEPNYSWGDSSGQGELPALPFAWVDIAGRSASIPGYDDLYTCNLPIGFEFPYYGARYTHFCASTNGFISFDDYGFSDLSNDCPLPSPLGNNTTIAAIWDDLVLMEGMSYTTLGAAPNRMLVVRWAGARRFGQPTERLADFQLLLHEDGQIVVQVRLAGTLTGFHSTTGLESNFGQIGVTYACNRSRTIYDNLAVRFAPNTRSLQPSEIAYRVVPAAGLGVNQWITNSVLITTPAAVLQRSVATLVNPVDLSASTATLSTARAAFNQTVRYTVAVRNTGLVEANALLAMSIPTATTFVEGSLVCDAGLCERQGSQIQWRGVALPGGASSLSFALQLTTPLPNGSPVVSRLRLEDGFGNRYERLLQFTAMRADLGASLVHFRPPYISPGGSATVLLFVRNNGTLATTATISHTPPAGLLVEESSLACGVGECLWADGTIRWSGAAPPASVVQVSYQVQAPATAVYGQSYPFRLQVSDAEGGTFEKSMLLLVARPMHLPLLYAEGQNGPIIPPPPLPAAAAGQTEAVVVPLGPPWAEGTGLVESQAQQ